MGTLLTTNLTGTYSLSRKNLIISLKTTNGCVGNLNSVTGLQLILLGLGLGTGIRCLLQRLLQEQGQQNGQQTGRQTSDAAVAAQVGHGDHIAPLVGRLAGVLGARGGINAARLHGQIERRALRDGVVAVAGTGQIVGVAVAVDLHTVLVDAFRRCCARGCGGVLLRPLVAARRADGEAAAVLGLDGHHAIGARTEEVVGGNAIEVDGAGTHVLVHLVGAPAVGVPGGAAAWVDDAAGYCKKLPSLES